MCYVQEFPREWDKYFGVSKINEKMPFHTNIYLLCSKLHSEDLFAFQILGGGGGGLQSLFAPPPGHVPGYTYQLYEVYFIYELYEVLLHVSYEYIFFTDADGLQLHVYLTLAVGISDPTSLNPCVTNTTILTILLQHIL